MNKKYKFDPVSFKIYNPILKVYREFLYSKRTFISFDKNYVYTIRNFFDFHALVFQIDDIEKKLGLEPENKILMKIKKDLEKLLKDRTLVKFERNVDFSLEWEQMYICFNNDNNYILF